MLTAALAHAGRGWPVFPLEPGGKRPLARLAPHGFKQVTPDPGAIRAWWSQQPDANIGIRTGVTFDVLDIDGPDALTALDRTMPTAVDPANDPYLIGPTVRTPRGWHLYVAATGRGNSVNVGGLAGVDWRGAGGYIVAAGSIREDGTRWSEYLPGDPLYGLEADIRPAPAWLLGLAQKKAVPLAPGGQLPTDRYGQAALERELGRLIMAPVGERNHQLNKTAHALGQLIAAGTLDRGLVVSRLVETAQRIGLDEAEAERTIVSGLRAGMASPRRIRS